MVHVYRPSNNHSLAKYKNKVDSLYGCCSLHADSSDIVIRGDFSSNFYRNVTFGRTSRNPYAKYSNTTDTDDLYDNISKAMLSALLSEIPIRRYSKILKPYWSAIFKMYHKARRGLVLKNPYRLNGR